MTWIFFVLGAYALFSLCALIDKYLISKVSIRPAVYVFYMGVLGMAVFVLVPFVGFAMPTVPQLISAIGAGITMSLSAFWYVKGLRVFESSRIVPAVGGLVPILVTIFIFIVSRGVVSISFIQLLSLLLLITGSVLIAFERGKGISLSLFRVAAFSAFFAALALVMAKYTYMALPFWTGIMMMRLGGFLVSLFFFVFSQTVQEEIFARKGSALPARKNLRATALFLFNQAAGASAEVLRQFAIFLAPLIMIPFVSAMQGVQYIIILILATLLSVLFPRILKEQLSKKTIAQKVIAIVFIIAGFIMLSFA